MLNILYIDGFKYIGSPNDVFASNFNLGHIPNYHNFRKNCTYIHLKTTNWEKDRLFFDFLMIHIQSMEMVKKMIDSNIAKNPTNKTFHVVIRQDDDNPEFYGKETYIISNKMPKKIKEYIEWGKSTFLDF